MIQHSTRLGEDETEQFIAMSKQERKDFLLVLGRREWDAREEQRLTQELVEIEQMVFDNLVKEHVGKDLLEIQT